VGVSDAALPRYTLGFFADCEYEGRGYVAEAVRAVLHHLFNGQRAHKVDLRCDETNVRCWRLAERCGFQREARLREDKRNADGSISGSLCYALLREQYAETQLREAALSSGR
jgi:[ribosomal protein S5]-alanine N-acetyltransferase